MKKCIDCGKPYKRVGNTKRCVECAFLKRHKVCRICGKIFVAPEGYIGVVRKNCFDCEPLEGEGKKPNKIDEELMNARKAGMTYGHYQQWKYQQECRGKRKNEKEQ